MIRLFDNLTDRSQVIALWENIFGYETAHNVPSAVIDRKLDVNDSLFFVATAGTEIIGTVMAGYDGHRGWIYSVAVHPTHRGQGTGSRLVGEAERALTGLGCMKINLQIVQDNADVAAFYASLGYTAEPRISMGKRIDANIRAH